MISVRQVFAWFVLVFSFALHCDVAPAAAQQTRYASANLRLRVDASVRSQAIGSIPRGASVRVGRCAANWCAVTYRGSRGYASQRYLRWSVPRARVEYGRPAEGRGYTNSQGDRVRSPVRSRTAPAGASARCRDGTYSFSRSRRGTCPHHGGVATWL